MPKERMPRWLMVVLAAVGLLVLSIPGLWVFVSITAKPLHPNPETVPHLMHSPPPAKWAGVVEHGRRTVRESVAAQNLPGVSVAVGIDGDLVWAEGFGFADLKTGVPVTPASRRGCASSSAWPLTVG